MARKINHKGLEKIKLWEGLRLKAYEDESKVLTIGYGHTSNSLAPRVTAGMEITEAEAEEILKRDIAIHERRVERLVKVPLTDNQFAALVSFDFNTGALDSSTLLKRLNAGDYAAVPTEMARWNKTTVKGRKIVSNGLVNRRAAEAGLWASGAAVASACTTVAVTPLPAMTKETISWGAGVVATLAVSFQGTGPVQYVLGGVIAVSFAVALWLFIKRRINPS